MSFGTGVGNKTFFYDDGGANPYGVGVQAGVMQIFSPLTTTRVGIGYGKGSEAFVEVLTVKGSNVGINTSSPSTPLHVLMGDSATTLDRGIRLEENSTDYWQLAARYGHLYVGKGSIAALDMMADGSQFKSPSGNQWFQYWMSDAGEDNSDKSYWTKADNGDLILWNGTWTEIARFQNNNIAVVQRLGVGPTSSFSDSASRESLMNSGQFVLTAGQVPNASKGMQFAILPAFAKTNLPVYTATYGSYDQAGFFINTSIMNNATYGYGYQTVADVIAGGFSGWSAASGGSEFRFFTKPRGTGSTYTQAMTIAHNGAVGIGAAVPNSTLDVSGNVNVSQDVSIDGNLAVGTTAPLGKIDVLLGSGQKALIRTGVNQDANFQITEGTGAHGGFFLVNGTNNRFVIGTLLSFVPTEVISIMYGNVYNRNNVGIGVSSPASRLHVNGNITLQDERGFTAFVPSGDGLFNRTVYANTTACSVSDGGAGQVCYSFPFTPSNVLNTFIVEMQYDLDEPGVNAEMQVYFSSSPTGTANAANVEIHDLTSLIDYSCQEYSVGLTNYRKQCKFLCNRGCSNPMYINIWGKREDPSDVMNFDWVRIYTN